MPTAEPLDRPSLRNDVDDAIARTRVVDIHTHLFPPSFDGYCLRGIDELVTYHYLVAEMFRSSSVRPGEFWRLTKSERADLVWDTLFVRNTPLSEACRGVVYVLTSLGLDPHARTLAEAREFFADLSAAEHIDRVLEISNVAELVMTNDPFDRDEGAKWDAAAEMQPRFHAAMRLDRMINEWDASLATMEEAGFRSDSLFSGSGVTAARRFLDGWIERMRPLYLAVSVPPEFVYGDDSSRTRALREVVLPTAQSNDLPFALMIGAVRGVNPELREAGDGVGRADIRAVERICRENPENRFLVTMLSRENQHELCVAARKFANLTPFGCWWFLNNPSIVSEITDERLELLGASFVPQHSDARILDQLIYKWAHARRAIADSLFGAYSALVDDGYRPTHDQIERDAERLLAGNARQLLGL
jgi:hypothetical protein